MVNTTTEEPVSDRLPYWLHVLALILYIFMFLLAILGNSIALWTLRRNPELRTLTHAFLTNLVVADLLLSLLTPLEALSLFLRSYEFGDPGCKLQRTFLYFFYAASILTLSAISLERFVAICYPMKYDSFKDRKTKILACIWLTSVVIVLPHIYLSEERTLNGDTVCFQFYTTEDSRVGFFWGYAVPCFVLLYLAPLTIMSVTYWKAAQKLAEMEERFTVSSQFDLSTAVRMRKEVLKMLFVVVVVFVVQWTPFEIVEILATAPGVMKVKPISSLRVTVNMLAFSNAVCNPAVYGFMLKQFREGFKEAGLYLVKFRCCPAVQTLCWCSCCNALPLPNHPLSVLRREKKNNESSTQDLTESTTGTRSDIDWDSCFSKLGNPVSIVQNELPAGDNTDAQVCATDRRL